MTNCKFSRKRFSAGVLLLLPFVFAMQCAKNSPEPPRDVLNIAIGMSRDDVRARLSGSERGGQLERAEGKRQEIWAFPNDARFSRAAIGYDSDDKVKFITAFARAKGSTTQIRYQEFGDLKAARQNVFMANVEYVWEVPAQNDKPAFFVIIRGFDPTYATSASLMKSSASGKEIDEDEDK